MNTIVSVGEIPKTVDRIWHTQASWELIYCTSGMGTFRFADERIFTCGKGEAIAIPPDLAHTYPDGEAFTGIHLAIMDPSFSYNDIFVVQDEDALLYHAVATAKALHHSGKNRKELVLESLGDLIVSYLIMFRSNVEYSELVEMIRSEILNNYTNSEFSLNEYLHSISFHYDYLRRIFKKEIGMSPLEYLISQRMKKAERLLSTMMPNGCPIGEIAHMCGYENALYFSRVFRKYYGCSPTQFVNRQRENRAAALD